jgi:hypothetical protein
MKTKRGTMDETSKKWMIYLNDLKKEIDYTGLRSLSEMDDKHNVTHRLGRFLRISKIIYKNEYGLYKWNEKIPVSIKIINSFRKWQSSENSKIFRSKHIGLQQEIKFTENNYNQFVTVEDAKKIYNKSETTIRNLIRDLRKTQNDNIRYSKSKNRREIILLKKSYLDSLYNNSNYELEELITKSKLYSPYQEKKVGIIRKFLRWIY